MSNRIQLLAEIGASRINICGFIYIHWWISCIKGSFLGNNGHAFRFIANSKTNYDLALFHSFNKKTEIVRTAFLKN